MKTFYFTFLLLFVFGLGSQAQNFVHPGLLHTQADLDRIKAKVAAKAEPWYTDYQYLKNARQTRLDWGARETAVIERGTGSLNNYIPMASAIACAYACAIVYHVEGDVAYANKSVDVIKRWARTLTSIGGTTDAALCRGAYGYQWACVGDLMYNYSGWTTAEKDTFKTMLNNVFYPGCKDFLMRHNDTKDSHYRCNWDGFNMAAIIAIGAFENDTAKFNEIVRYYKGGWYNTTKGRQIVPNGVISKAVNYIHDNGLGQCEESGRDQPHAITGIGLLAHVCQIAWNQGVDLFGYDDNRLMKGLEYTAKYNLFNAVPYQSHTFQMSNDGWPFTTNTEHYLGASGRGDGSLATWELVYNHYVKIKGLQCPYIEQKAARMRPELGGGYYGLVSSGFDFLGYGTLMYSQSAPTLTTHTITFPTLPTLKAGDAPYSPTATSNVGLTVRYSSDNTYIADIVDNKIVALRAGTATITAWSNGNSTYNVAPMVSQTLTVTAANTPAFSGKQQIAAGTGYRMMDNISSTTDNTYLYVYNDVWDTYSTWDGAVNPIFQMWNIKSISGNDFYITCVHSGKALSVESSSTVNSAKVVQRAYTATADQIWTIIAETSDNYGRYKITNKASGRVLSITNNNTASGAQLEIRDDAADSSNQRFYISPVGGILHQQTLTFNDIPTKFLGNVDFSPATSSSSLSPTYSSSNTAVATIVNNQVHIVGAGTSQITAYQDGNDVINPATSISKTLTVYPIMPGVYKFTNRTSGLCIDNIGLTASASTVGQYTSGTSNNQRWVVSFADGYYKIAGVTGGLYLDSYNNTANGSNVVQYANSTSPNQQWSFVATGTYYKIQNRANSKCLDNYGLLTNSAPILFYANGTSNNQQWTVSAVSTNQSISLDDIPTKFVGDSDFTVPASISSGLALTFTSSISSVATIVNGKIHIVGAGTTTITAAQAGTTAFNATSVSKTLTVMPLAPGVYKFFNRTSGKCLDNYSSYVAGASAVQWTSGVSSAQQWSLTFEDGYYKLRCLYGGLYLDSYGNIADASLVCQGGTTNINQQWTIEMVGTYYRFINRANGKCLDNGGSTANGGTMKFYVSSASYNQQWSVSRLKAAEVETMVLENEQKNVSTFKVYPNPATSTITINLPTNATNLGIFDLQGKLILSKTTTNPQLTIGIDHLPTGLYIIKVATKDKIFVEKLIKN